MTMRKTMTAAALCTVALGSLIAQPAFASTLIDPSPKVSASGNQVNAADLAMSAMNTERGYTVETTLTFPGGTAYGQLKITAPQGTKITATDWTEYIAPDGSYALMGKNSDYWNASRKITFKVLESSVAGSALTGGKVEVVKDGVTNKSLDFSGTVKSAFSTVSTPSFAQATTGVSTVKFGRSAYGQLKFTAPTGTRITATNYAGCTISPDGLTALCGVNTDTWGADRTVTLESDGTHTGTFTDGKVEAIYDGLVRDTHSLGATITPNLTATDAVINAGEEGTATVKIGTSINGRLEFIAPTGTKFKSINSPYCVISADGSTADCGVQPNWGADKVLTFKIDANVAPGTVYTGGSAKATNAAGKLISTTAFKITVGNKVAKPTVTVSHNVLSGTGIPGATINVRNDANEIVGTQVVPASGNWSIVVPFQGTGNKTVNVSQVYGTGTSDTVLATINFGNGVQITTPANGSTVTTEKVTFTGTGTVGATIQVNGSTKNICTTEVKNDGTWSCESAIPLPNGPLVFGIKQISGTIESSTTVSFTKKYSASAAAVKFTEPAAGSTVYNVRPVFKGTGQPGAAIRVFGTSKTVASATVKEDGTWEAPATMDLGGDYTLNVEQTPANGAATSRDTVSFKVRAGEASDVVVTTPAQDSTVTTKMVTYTGKGEPGAKIVINGTSKQIASATVKGDGTWEAPGTFELQNGKYTFKVTQTLANGDMKHTDLTFYIKAS
ncbi:Ig-like domain-containing protein [Mycetocola sp. JXN-3]|uniref:Ig-like domain-containing protein n=1 Tax=Mycetocola sp. JXN-3 TaxID=2116510 RepID=UPI00165D2A12|nr:Ig-like domain-containing protein [Mycetocola sp. JXN-3]